MANLNKVFLIGRLTKDPELRHLPNGTPKAELRMASSRTYTTNGERREDTCYVDIVAWSRQAEIVNQYLKKGSQIFVEGRLDYQEWTSQDGSKRSKHQVVADRVQFLDPRGGGQGSGPEIEAGEDMGAGRPRFERQGGRAYGYAPRTNAPAATSNDAGAPEPAVAPASAPAAAVGGVTENIAHSAVGGMSGDGIADDDIPF
ncbi:single-stranded DNA-binding protein [bacterium]|nr:single-stranded DNA-binding protein [bacterium]